MTVAAGPVWRAALRRELAVLVLLKLAALALLWGLCFSPAQRLRVDTAAAARVLGVPGADGGEQAR